MPRILRTLSRVLTSTPAPTAARVHFHGGPHGAYVCEYAVCDSPQLDPREQ